MSYYILSNELIDYKENTNITNRAFKYSDSIFETMYYTNNKIISLDKHWKRLLKGIKLLKMQQTHFKSEEILENKCRELILKNNIIGAARIRLQIYRSGDGLYLPQTNQTEYILEAKPLINNNYTLNKIGLVIGIAEHIFKDASYLSKIKTTAKQEMILASIEAKENGWDDALLLNSKGNIVEASSSNIIIIKANKIITPKLSDGALNGVMRQNILELARQLNIEVEESSIKPTALYTADEILLTNAIKGIQWVGKIANREYKNNFSTFLINKLNSRLIQ